MSHISPPNYPTVAEFFVADAACDDKFADLCLNAVIIK